MAEQGSPVGAVSREPAREGRDEAVSYEALQDLLRAERRSNKLMPLAPRFWTEVRGFLQAVTEAFRLEQAQDPFGRKVMRLTDEVKNARHAAEAVWALRERKLAMLALAATRERKPPEGITPEESELYRRMLEGLDASRSRVFDGLLPPAQAQPAAVPASPPPTAATEAPSPAVQMPITPAPVAPAPLPARPAPIPAPAAPAVVPPDTKGPAPEMVTIRALGDIPPFVGPDMQTYLLKAGDVATVPPSIANLLVRRSKAAVVNL